MKKSKNAFTMIEMIFVIVVLGILASIAIPKLAATRTDAEITKGRADIASIRSAIVSERQSRLIKGDSGWVGTLDDGTGNYFIGPDNNHTLLMYGIAPGGKWSRNNGTTYTFTLGATVTFNYAAGVFTCSTTAGTTAQQELCKNLIN